MFFNLEVHGCALNFIHNIYLFLTDGAWVEKSFVFQIWGGGLIIASQNKTGSSVGYDYAGLVNYKHIDSGCHLGSWDQVWVARGGGSES